MLFKKSLASFSFSNARGSLSKLLSCPLWPKLALPSKSLDWGKSTTFNGPWLGAKKTFRQHWYCLKFSAASVLQTIWECARRHNNKGRSSLMGVILLNGKRQLEKSWRLNRPKHRLILSQNGPQFKTNNYSSLAQTAQPAESPTSTARGRASQLDFSGCLLFTKLKTLTWNSCGLF